jgi:hypothetical protein
MSFTLRKQTVTNSKQKKHERARMKRTVLAIVMGALLILLSISSTNFVMTQLSVPMMPEAIAQDSEEGEENEQNEISEQEQEEGEEEAETNLEDNSQELQDEEREGEERPTELETIQSQEEEQGEVRVTEDDEIIDSSSMQESVPVDDDSKRDTAMHYLDQRGHKLGYETINGQATGWEWGAVEAVNDPASPRLQAVTQDVAEQDSKQALKVTVYPGDTVNNGARAEVKHTDNQLENKGWFNDSDEVYYKWYTKIPTDFPIRANTFHLITQWHQEATGEGCNGDPTIAGCKGVPLQINLRDEDNDGNPTLQLLVINRADSSYFDKLWDYELTQEDRNTWHQFLLHVKWSGCDQWNNENKDQCMREDDGAFIEFWFNGTKQELKRPETNKQPFYNMDKDNVVYMKQGLYHCRLGSNNCPYVSTDAAITIYHDGMRYLKCSEGIPESDKAIICGSATPPGPPPSLIVPNNIVVQATTANDGTSVTYTVKAEDDVDGTATLKEDGTITQDDVGGHITISCEPASGSKFPVGETTVQCSATDAAGNKGTASFRVTVNDPVCENAQDRIKQIDAEIARLQKELNGAPTSQKSEIVGQIRELQDERASLRSRCGL